MDQMYQALKRLRRFAGAMAGECFKKPFATRDEADAHARRVRHYYGVRQSPYLCWCGHWHLCSKRGGRTE